ncbi:hypothetical protein FACS1894145_2550 [Bacteroidia bacterium]|nr:hypothetical protein FACS1894145_2550 [Bacteroidia bacterium]
MNNIGFKIIMKHLLIIFSSLFLFTSVTVNAQHKLTVIVDGIKKQKGKLMIGVYNSDATFMKKTYKGFAADVTDTTLEFTIDLPTGEYAISLYHDANGNNKLDTGIFGIPTEGYGFSNNVKGFMGPPSFEKSKFSLTDSLIIRINLIN